MLDTYQLTIIPFAYISPWGNMLEVILTLMVGCHRRKGVCNIHRIRLDIELTKTVFVLLTCVQIEHLLTNSIICAKAEHVQHTYSPVFTILILDTSIVY